MPLELHLKYEGGGVFRTQHRLDWEIAERELTPGARLRAKLSNVRSVSQNNLFHSMVDLAFENQTSGPQFASPDALKNWLLIQVGHCDVKIFDRNAITKDMARELRRVFDVVDFTTDGKRLFMKVAKSVRFRTTDSAAMAKVFDDVAHKICETILPGMDVETLIAEAKARGKGQ